MRVSKLLEQYSGYLSADSDDSEYKVNVWVNREYMLGKNAHIEELEKQNER